MSLCNFGNDTAGQALGASDRIHLLQDMIMNVPVQQLPSGPIHLHFEGIGTITLPGADTLAFLAGVGVLAFIGLVEWPLAALVIIARLFTGARSGALRGLGDALAIAR